MKTLFTLLLITFSLVMNAQAPNYIWAKNYSNSRGVDVTTDSLGNSYIVGAFNNGNLIKNDPSGNMIWMLKIGDSTTDVSMTNVIVDMSNNCIVAGWFKGSIIIGLDTITNSSTIQNSFIAKYDSNGVPMWGKSLSGDFNLLYDIKSDKNNNIYVTGLWDININFGSINLSNSNGNVKMFLAKYNQNGNALWANSSYGNASEEAYSLQLDKNENCLVTGVYYGIGSSTSAPCIIGSDTLATYGGNDFFVAKFDSSGNVIFAKGFGGSSQEEAYKVDVDTIGNCFIWGGFRGSFSIDSITLTTVNSSWYSFIIKLDSIGNVVLAKNLNIQSNGLGYGSIKTDKIGNILYASVFYSTWNLTINSSNLVNSGGSDLLLVKYDSSINPVWFKTDGGASNEEIYSLFIDKNEDIYICGRFQSPVLILTSPQFIKCPILLNNTDIYPDAFVAKINSSKFTTLQPIYIGLAGTNTFCQGTPINLFAASGSGYTYQWYRNGTIIPGATAANYAATTAGNYSVRIDSGGCYGISPAQAVSFYSLPNVGISNSTGTVVCSGSPVTLNGTGAISYTWNNGVVNNTTFYPSSTNTYQVIGTDVHGCTNVNSTTISVNGLPFVQSIIGNPSIVPFQNYIYGVNSTPGVSFNWLIQGGFIQSGQGTNSVNVIWGSNGPYLLQLVQSNANGCSDISSLAVINSNCSITYTVQQVGTAPYCQGDSITLSVATAPGTQFQWLLNGAPINNAIATSVTATQSGVYQVQMTQAGCTALSNGNSITFLQAPATPVITASGAGSGCLGGTQSLSCPAGYASYLWNNGTTTASTIANNSGNYVVTVTGANGCEATSSPFFVNLSLLSSADICLVSVDDVTNKNVVIWEKPILTGVDSFYVYKESTSSNVYTKIGSVAVNAFSTFTDNNSNPLQRADRYKISILDTCGFESSPSTIHKTIHLSINQGVGNTYNLIWDAYEGFVFGTYYILRGTSPNNLVTIDSIQSNLLSYTDLNPPAGTVYYAIEVRKAIQCNPTARTSSLGYASSRSNIKDNALSSLNDYTNPFNSFTIVPNPATENTSVNLNLSNTSLTNISVFDMTGRLIQILNNSTLTAGNHSFTWDLNENNAKAKAGIYLIKVAANGYTQTKRVVVL